ncbi:MAG TPA: ATP-binding protein [Bryobacteraceae bacterium]|jgi:signal transduction histidine kinase|nr:ATP-binding protein [Bryobacteraceae bacterium]
MNAVGSATSVLLNVDDVEPIRYARSRLLRQAGFDVHEADSGRAALRLIPGIAPDLVLLDVHLPDISGIAVCRQIKRDLGSGIIVLQISGSATSAPQATVALNSGADCYLVEPVDPDVLVATVRALLRLRTAERALATANQQLSDKNAELQRVNKALLRSNQDLEHFAYVGSHDLQEPLRNIVTHIELLQRHVAPRFDESEQQLFSVVVDGARRMRALIQDVLAYSGVGKESPTFGPTRLQEALDLALANLADGIKEAPLCLSARQLPEVWGDVMQLSRVFQNLIGNSIKYRLPDVPLRVDITAEKDPEGDWIIAVHDNGIGIATQHLEKIFEPFKRLHGYEIAGTGIGLALCRRIIEAHGGRIWAESRPGEGTRFLFTLPPAESHH